MKIGAILRADDTGLGVQSLEFYNHIKPDKVLLVDSSLLGNLELLNPKYDRFPGAMMAQLREDYRKAVDYFPTELINTFIDGLDLVFAMETPYDYAIFRECRKRGIKTVLQFNYEFLDFPSAYPPPDLFAAPSRWHWEECPNPKIFLPVPVDTKKFTPKRKPRTFVHNAGRPAAYDRNGTITFLDSLRYVNNPIQVELRCQRPMNVARTKPHIKIKSDFTNRKNYWEGYDGGVFVLPRKYGGLCLPTNEALASGMPVIMTDIDPNNRWLPKEWLIRAIPVGVLKSKRRVQMFQVHIAELGAKIDQFCDEDFYNKQVDRALEIADTISWDRMLPLYMETFDKLIHGQAIEI